MNLFVYTNKSPQNAVNKELQGQGVYRDVYLKTGGSDFLRPVLRLDLGQTARMVEVNYCQLSYGGRNYFYFVTNKTFIDIRTCELQLSLDVLMSYQQEIREQTALVKRQEYEFNMYITDGALKTYANPKFQQKLFPYGFNTNSFILTV